MAQYVCDEPACVLHILIPDGAVGEWAEIEIDGHSVMVTWTQIGARRLCQKCASRVVADQPPVNEAVSS